MAPYPYDGRTYEEVGEGSLVLKYRLNISILFNGWVTFHFLNSEDVERILKEPWVKGQGFLIMQRWKAGFDSFSERPCRYYIWASFPGLPLELLNEEAIKEISHMIGSYYYRDEGSFRKLDKRMAWVLIEVEMGQGLLAELEI